MSSSDDKQTHLLSPFDSSSSISSDPAELEAAFRVLDPQSARWAGFGHLALFMSWLVFAFVVFLRENLDSFDAHWFRCLAFLFFSWLLFPGFCCRFRSSSAMSSPLPVFATVRGGPSPTPKCSCLLPSSLILSARRPTFRHSQS